jgi:hypothetical protein
MIVPRLVLAALLGAAGLVLFTPVAAHACSCVGGDVAAYADRADVVFTGTLMEVTPPPARLFWSSGDPATYSFDVERVHLGEVGPSTEVRSAVSGASCGLEGMRTGSRYVVFATLDDGLWANLCGGTDLARPGVVRRLERAVGPARAPASDPPAAVAGSVGSVESDGSPGLPGLGLAGVGGLLATVAGVAVASWAVRSRVSSSGPGSTSRGARPGAARTPGGSWARRPRARSARGGRPTWPRR